MNKSGSDFAGQIGALLSTTPRSADLENGLFDGINAKVVSRGDEDEGNISKICKESDEFFEDSEDECVKRKIIKQRKRSIGSNDSIESDDCSTDNEDDLEEDDEDEEEEETSIVNDNEGDTALEDNKVISHVKNLVDPNKSEKGQHVRNQMAVWENFLEIRIHLQKCLIAANKIPAVNEAKQEHGAELSKTILMTKNSTRDALDKLLLLQSLLLKQYPETKTPNALEQTINDEEILSDTEEELSEKEFPVKKRRKLDEYEKDIQEQHNGYTKYRNDVIRKWNDKTCIVLNKAVSTNSVLNQIEHNLLNKDKLIKRTQINRFQDNSTEKNLVSGEQNLDAEYNSEIFDDSDFYHQLLRELIEVKSADVTDPLQLGQQWIQLQSLRNKSKRKVDTKATKGRKIRYAVHNKLVNFMAPIEQNLWTENATNDLFNSLFEKTNCIK